MKSKEVLWILTLICAMAFLLEVSHAASRLLGPLWFPLTGGLHEYHRVFIFVFGVLLLQPLYRQGHRWSLIPLAIVICLLNPPAGWFKPFSIIWQPWALGAIVFAAYIPGVRSLTAKLWRE